QLLRELDDVERADLDREIDDESLAGALLQEGSQHVAIILAREALLQEADPAHVQKMAMRIGGIDDREAALVEVEVPLDQRQDAAPDGAQADEDDGAGNLAVNGPKRGHGGSLLGLSCGAVKAGRGVLIKPGGRSSKRPGRPRRRAGLPSAYISEGLVHVPNFAIIQGQSRDRNGRRGATA